MRIRDREERDRGALIDMAQAVRRRDDYPAYLPEGDLPEFLVRADALGAWVAESAGALCGHVAVHARSSPQVMALAARTLGVSEGEVGVVARLFVAPGQRRRGVANALVVRAWSEAARLGRWPVLDVLPQHGAAVALYEACGWRRVGRTVLELPGRAVPELVYVAPTMGPPAPSA